MYPDYPSSMPVFAYLSRPLCESALAEPRQTFGGRYLRRTIYDKAASLFYSLIKNHPFVDGNKRIALSALAVFLILNDYIFYVQKEEAVQYALCVATSQEDMRKEIAAWIRRNSLSYKRVLSMTDDELAGKLGLLRPGIRVGHRAADLKIKRTLDNVRRAIGHMIAEETLR